MLGQDRPVIIKKFRLWGTHFDLLADFGQLDDTALLLLSGNLSQVAHIGTHCGKLRLQ